MENPRWLLTLQVRDYVLWTTMDNSFVLQLVESLFDEIQHFINNEAGCIQILQVYEPKLRSVLTQLYNTDPDKVELGGFHACFLHQPTFQLDSIIGNPIAQHVYRLHFELARCQVFSLQFKMVYVCRATELIRLMRFRYISDDESSVETLLGDDDRDDDHV